MTQPASKRLVSEARLTDITTAATNAGIASAQSQINSSAAAAASSATAAQNSANLVGAPADTAIAAAVNGASSATRSALYSTFVALQPALELMPLYATGHSWVDGGRPMLWWNRLASRLRSGATSMCGYSGRTIGDVALATLSSPGTDFDTRPIWTAGSRSLITAICTINDSTVWKGTPASHVGYKHAWRALLSQLTGDTPVSADSDTFVYDSTFTALSVTRSIVQGAATNATGRRQWRTTTVGGYFQFNVTGPSVDVVLMARAAGAGLVTFTVGGTTVGTLDLTAATAQDCPAVAQLRNIGTGTQTVRGTLTSGTSLTVDSYRVPLATPTQGIVLGEPLLIKSATDLASWWSDVQAYKAELATIVADFPSFAFLDLENEPGWDRVTMTMPDARHPNDIGGAWVADRVARRLQSFGFTAGMHYTNTAIPTAYVRPAGPAQPSGGQVGGTFMTDTAPYTGTTDTGSLTWTAATGTNHVYRSVDVGSGDVIIKAVVTAISQTAPVANTPCNGVAVRVSDSGNGIQLEVTPTQYKFTRYLTGAWSQLQSYGISGSTAGPAPAVGDVVEMRTKANLVQCYVNGAKVMEHTNLTQNQTTTKHGLIEGDTSATGTTYSIVSIAAN